MTNPPEPRPRGFHFLDDVEVETLPDPAWDVPGMLTAGSLGVLYGQPGVAKSFLALDLAFSIATATPFLERDVVGGPVIYVAAESSTGLKLRIHAWKSANEWSGLAGVRFLFDAPAFLEPSSIRQLLDAIRATEAPPRLVIVDTIARTMSGGDENDTKSMSAYVAAVDRIRAATGATVLLVHHTNKAGEQERGNSSLRGAADTMMLLRKDGPHIKLECTKQREAKEFDPIALRLVIRGESAVLVTSTDSWKSGQSEMDQKERSALESLSRDFLDEGAATTAWCKASLLPDSSFYRARTSLVRRGYVDQEKNGSRVRYRMSEMGKKAVASNFQNTSNALPDSGSKSLPSTTPPLGGGSEGRKEVRGAV